MLYHYQTKCVNKFSFRQSMIYPRSSSKAMAHSEKKG